MQPYGRALVASVALVMALVLLGAEGVGHAQTPQAQVAALPSPGFTVRVAVLVPRTGGAAAMGESVLRGIKLANEVLSPQWDLDVVTMDTQCDGVLSGPAASQVISDGIHYILGEVCTGASVAVSEIAEANGVLQISPTSTGINVTTYPDGSDKRYVFRTCLADPVQSRVMAAVADGIVGAQTAGVLYNSQSGYSLNTANEFMDAFEQRGGVVAPYAQYTMDDHAGAVAELQEARPDVVFVSDENVATLNSLVADIRTAGITATLLGGDAWDSSDLDLGAAEGAYFPSFFAIEDDRQAVIDFVAAYVPYFGEEPNGAAALGYDTMAALLRAISDAGVDDPAAARDALQELMFEGVTGFTRFDAVGDVIKGLAVMQVQGGQRVVSTRFEPVSGLSAAIGGPVVLGETMAMTATVTEGGVVSYAWDLGDGTLAEGASITHTYAAAGAYGVIVTATNVLNSEVVSATAVVQEEVAVTAGSVVTTTDGRVALAAPPTMTPTLTVTYTPQLTATQGAGELAFGGVAFRLEGTDAEGQPIDTLATPLTLTVSYREGDLAPGSEEAALAVWRWDEEGQDWVPLEVVARDEEGNALTVLLDHLSEFALLAPVERRVYVPLLRR